MMLIGNLALTGFGIPFLHIGAAGFYSKDAIIDVDFAGSTGMDKYAFMMTAVAALMTSFYSWRQFLMTFHGRYRGLDKVQDLSHSDAHTHDEPLDGHAHDDHGHQAPKLEEIHEAPLTMLLPLGVLAIGALFAGAVFDTYFIGANSAAFWHGAVAAIAGDGTARKLLHFV